MYAFRILLLLALLMFISGESFARKKKPKIKSQKELTTKKETSITLKLADYEIDVDKDDDDDDEDDGEDNNEDLVLRVYDGSGYARSGNTVTPAVGFVGVLTVPVQVFSGSEASNVFETKITVIANNDDDDDKEIEIKDQKPLRTNQNTSITLSVSDFVLKNADDDFPASYSLEVGAGANYSVSGTTITPAPGFSGNLSVPVIIRKAEEATPVFYAIVEVQAVNSQPVITGQTNISTNEDTPLTLALSDFSVSDADDTYPNGFTLQVASGTNYTVSGTTITPSPNFSGTLTVPVTVNDGEATSSVFNATVNVNPVNDPPVITGQQSLSTAENQSVTIALTNLSVTDPDDNYPEGFTLSLSDGDNYSVSGLTITPDNNFSGELRVPATVSDGEATSNVFNLVIQVSAVNNAPVITGQGSIVINEDASYTIPLNVLTVADSDNNYPQGFTLQVGAGANYSVSGNTITPAADFTGTLTVPVTVSDGSNTSNTFNLSITVNALNDAPVITGQKSKSGFMGEPFSLTVADVTVRDADTDASNLVLVVLPGNNYTAQGNTVTPAATFQGTLTVNVAVSDGQASSTSFPLLVNITEKPNIAPLITGQVEVTTYENQPIEIQLANLIVIDPDDNFPQGFTLRVFPGPNYILNATTITPSASFSGKLTVPVLVNDGKRESNVFNLSVDVLPVSDVPLITNQRFLRTDEEKPLTLTLQDLTVVDPDDTYPGSFTLQVLPGTNYSVSGATITPASNFNGDLAVPVTVNDGENTSDRYILRILVDPVNDPPSIENLETEAIAFKPGDQGELISNSLVIVDVDDDSLSFAEVTFNPETFEPGDSLTFVNSNGIRGVYDASAGVLALLGKASLSSYQEFIRNIQYVYTRPNMPVYPEKQLQLVISDGKISSSVYVRPIRFGDAQVVLDIPEAFTPNDDGANDTWRIQTPGGAVPEGNLTIRVYNKRGVLVYEAREVTSPWDGRSGGALLPSDVYFYTIQINTQTIKGTVAILH